MKRTKLFKMILLLVVIAIAATITIYLIPMIKDLGTQERAASL